MSADTDGGFDPRGFTGDFDFLPFRAHLLYGAVPEFPREEDFQGAVTDAIDGDAAALWRVNAIRWRIKVPGKPLDLKAIALETAADLFRRRDQ